VYDARQFGSPENVFRAPLRQLEGCEMPAATAQAIFKKEVFKRAEKELAGVRAIPGWQLVNWSEPEYPQTIHRCSCMCMATYKF
jgi:hypothetical protein